jgi:hypothetical protein
VPCRANAGIAIMARPTSPMTIRIRNIAHSYVAQTRVVTRISRRAPRDDCTHELVNRHFGGPRYSKVLRCGLELGVRTPGFEIAGVIIADSTLQVTPTPRRAQSISGFRKRRRALSLPSCSRAMFLPRRGSCSSTLSTSKGRGRGASIRT